MYMPCHPLGIVGVASDIPVIFIADKVHEVSNGLECHCEL